MSTCKSYIPYTIHVYANTLITIKNESRNRRSNSMFSIIRYEQLENHWITLANILKVQSI